MCCKWRGCGTWVNIKMSACKDAAHSPHFKKSNIRVLILGLTNVSRAVHTQWLGRGAEWHTARTLNQMLCKKRSCYCAKGFKLPSCNYAASLEQRANHRALPSAKWTDSFLHKWGQMDRLKRGKVGCMDGNLWPVFFFFFFFFFPGPKRVNNHTLSGIPAAKIFHIMFFFPF